MRLEYFVIMTAFDASTLIQIAKVEVLELFFGQCQCPGCEWAGVEVSRLAYGHEAQFCSPQLACYAQLRNRGQYYCTETLATHDSSL